MDAVERAEAELYRLAPEDFVVERDAHVARAKEAGDRDAARAIAALRRPSRAAWLTNLLVHESPDEVEGLLGLADTLAAAQRSLDGGALRTISAQRSKLVGALSRQAAALGRDAGHRVESTLEREVRTVLESALADPELADRVRSGRLVKAERHAGFGPSPDEDAAPRPSRRDAGDAGPESPGSRAGRAPGDGGGRPDGARPAHPDGADGTDGSTGRAGASDRAGTPGRTRGSGRAEAPGRAGTTGRAGASGRDGSGDQDGGPDSGAPGRATGTDPGPDADALRRERAITRARADADRAREAAEKARERHETARADADEAARRRDRARDRVGELVEALELARTESGAANRAAHATATAEKVAARAARTADTARDRADAALRELQQG